MTRRGALRLIDFAESEHVCSARKATCDRCEDLADERQRIEESPDEDWD